MNKTYQITIVNIHTDERREIDVTASDSVSAHKQGMKKSAFNEDILVIRYNGRIVFTSEVGFVEVV